MVLCSEFIILNCQRERMLNGSREGVLRRMQPISIHGQLSYDVHYTFADESDGQTRVARIGPEALAPGLQIGDKIRLDFLVGVVTAIHRL
jgi:hypothetical protein